MDIKESAILTYLQQGHEYSSKEIADSICLSISYATVKRILTKLVSENLIAIRGNGKGTKYAVSPLYELLRPIDMDVYYQKEIDERPIKGDFNFDLLNTTLKNNTLFTTIELTKLQQLQEQYLKKTTELSSLQFSKELERLAIDLSWKSSQIEGNTYSLLETEKLLKEKETAAGKTKDEAVMLLNHKDAIDFVIEHTDYLIPISIAKIENIHSLLVKELPIERNLRKSRVGISGTNYKPLDNELQIQEALNSMCELINAKQNVFEKALLALVLIAYIQPFGDGNKRTARIVSNAILMSNNYCPISFRTVDSLKYKKSMLLFYEQNNISSFKEIFINQFNFAVNTYF